MSASDCLRATFRQGRLAICVVYHTSAVPSLRIRCAVYHTSASCLMLFEPTLMSKSPLLLFFIFCTPCSSNPHNRCLLQSSRSMLQFYGSLYRSPRPHPTLDAMGLAELLRPQDALGLADKLGLLGLTSNSEKRLPSIFDETNGLIASNN